MNAEIFAEWLRRQGQKVVRTPSSYWHSHALGVYQAFPYHWLIDPSPFELRELMYRQRAVAVRYSTLATYEKGNHSYHVVYAQPGYDFNALSAWARKNVRRGLRECMVGRISFERYVEEGWALRVDTLSRQERSLAESKNDWQRQYSTAADLEGFEVWAAEVRGHLAASLVVFRMDDWYYMVYQQCHRDYLRAHAPNALSFVVTQNLIGRPGVRGIFYGMQSLDAPASVDEFKFRMGYQAKAIRQRVDFHPCLRPLVNRASYRLVKAAAQFTPRWYWTAKTEGMFRLFLEGSGRLEVTAACSEARATSND